VQFKESESVKEKLKEKEGKSTGYEREAIIAKKDET